MPDKHPDNIRQLRQPRGYLLVCKKRCNECLFSDAALVDQRGKEAILDRCERDHTHFMCHKPTLYEDAPAHIRGLSVVCRGFWDAFPDTYSFEIARAVDPSRILFIDLDTGALAPIYPASEPLESAATSAG